MSVSSDKSPKSSDEQQLGVQERANIVIHESLLMNAFDDQIKLVEKSIAAAKGFGHAQKKKAANKSREKDIRPQVEQNPQKHQVYSNRSRIYRYDAGDGEDVMSSKPSIQIPIHPPLGPHNDSTDDPDSETDSRSNMLMSWYMAGYHTGYYDSMRKHKRDFE